MQGTHLTADLHGCAAGVAAMTDAGALRDLCLAAARRAALQPVGELFHRFPVGGVTGMVLLAESHVAVHTWPELDAATLDVYVCNVGGDNGAKAECLLDTLVAAFAPRTVERQVLRRGAVRTGTDAG